MIVSAGSPRRARLLGIAVLAVTFVAGGLSGAAFARLVLADEPPRAADRWDGDRRDDGKRGLYERLDLTPEQRVKIDAILERRRAEMQRFWDEHGPSLRAIVDSARAEVRTVLTPEQRALEDRLRAEKKARHRDHDRRDDRREESR